MSKVMISIVIPCYKQAAYLPETLNSVLSQTCTLWECIIVNDGSPDNTEEIALEYVNKDSRFKYIFKENGGLSSARNLGLEIAEGEFILPLDSDDIIAPEYLEKALRVFEEIPQTKLVYCYGVLFGCRTGAWNVFFKDYKSLLANNSIFCSAVFRRKEAIEVGGYDEQMLYGYEDWEFFIRFLDEKSRVYQIPLALFYYRTKSVSMLTVIANEASYKQKWENYIYMKHKEKYMRNYGSMQEVLRELENSRIELASCKSRISQYKNVWYRRYFKAALNLFRVKK